MSDDPIRKKMARLMRAHPDADTVDLMVVAHAAAFEMIARYVEQLNKPEDEEQGWGNHKACLLVDEEGAGTLGLVIPALGESPKDGDFNSTEDFKFADLDALAKYLVEFD